MKGEEAFGLEVNGADRSNEAVHDWRLKVVVTAVEEAAGVAVAAVAVAAVAAEVVEVAEIAVQKCRKFVVDRSNPHPICF